MSTLSPAPTVRARASSTSLRPSLSTLQAQSSASPPKCGQDGSRCRSSSYLARPQAAHHEQQSSLSSEDSDPDIEMLSSNMPPVLPARLEDISTASAERTVVSLLLARVLSLLPKHHTLVPDTAHTSPSSSARSSTDTILPLSSPPEKTSFGDVLEQTRPVSPSGRWRIPAPPSVHTPILVVITLFPLSTALVFLAISSLPISVSWPHNISELAALGRELATYTNSGWSQTGHVVAVMAISAIWKHAWSIPGSVLWNVLAGALFTPTFATVLLTLLTTLGSLAATLLAKPLAPLIMQFFPKVLNLTRNALEGGEQASTKPQSPAWVRLTILRLIGVVPWSGLNIACGVCGVSLFDCALGSFIGTLPWTAVTCQVGDILQTVASASGPNTQTIQSLLASPEIIMKLILLSFLSLAPILGRDRLKTMLSPSASEMNDSPEDREARRKWRIHLRLPSRSRPAMRGAESQRQLEILIEEKNRAELERA